MASTGKILIWTGVIAAIAVGGYLYYRNAKKKGDKNSNKPKINTEDAISVGAGVASFFNTLFGKKKTETPATEYALDEPDYWGVEPVTSEDYPYA